MIKISDESIPLKTLVFGSRQATADKRDCSLRTEIRTGLSRLEEQKFNLEISLATPAWLDEYVNIRVT